MANLKITELAELTTPQETDILPIVSDPSGTPSTRKSTYKTLFNKRILMSIVPAANFSLSTSTGVQSAFPTSGDVFTVEASSTYLFEGLYMIEKSGTTCTTAMAFALGGGASVTSFKYTALAQNIAKNTTGATHASLWVDTVSSTVVNATATTALYISFKGIIRTNAAGTVTPQINFSASPTAPTMIADSYIRFTRLGTNVENTIGTVA